MKLAVNYSAALLSLLTEDAALPVDYIKVPTIPFPDCWDQFDQGERYRRLLPHPAQKGIILLGHPEITERFNLKIIEKILNRTKPPYLSTHFEVLVEYFPELKEYQHQNHYLVKRVLMSHFLAAIKEIKAQINVPLVLENHPYYTWAHHFRIGSEPEFISEICERGDCGFLLDIAHARCSARYLQMDIIDYINALPLERLREIHLGGVQERAEGLRDTHTELASEDYRLLQSVLQKTSPEIITIEYGGLPDRIINLERNYEPLLRNNPLELKEMIMRVNAITGVRV